MNPSSESRLSLHVGRAAFDALAARWRQLEKDGDAGVFQRFAWARAWLDHLGRNGTPWILVAEGPQPVLWPFHRERRSGVRVLRLLGEGVSDYLGPIGAAGTPDSGADLAQALRRARPGFDLLDLRGLALPEPVRGALCAGLGPRALERVYERCPVIDTTGSWDDYLTSRRKKFRANLKRAARRVEEHGAAAVACEPPSPELVAELDAVERESWKWENGTAYFRVPERKAFLAQVLLDPEIPSEVWTCRVAGELAGFAVVFRAGRTRQYYLPSFRSRYTDVGSHLLGEIVRASFDDAIDEVDLLQGDEGYKMAWATHERAVHEVVAPRGWPLGPAAVLAVQWRWRLAQSERARRWNARLASWRGRQSGD